MSTPPPNIAEIPLPPGMDLQQFQSLQSHLVTLAITTAVAFGVMIWEYVNMLPDEIKFYKSSNKELWCTPAAYSFVILRYSGLIATFPALFFTSIQSNHCMAAVIISQLGVILVVAASGIIFCYRVFAIWSGNKIVYVFISVVYLGMLACWITVASHYRATNGPPTPFGSNCQMHPIVSWAPICNASSVLFDMIILILTLWKVGSNHGSRVGYLIYRDSVVYFLFTAVTNTVVLVIQALGPSWALTKPAVLPFSTVITATMGVRVFLNLRLLNQREVGTKNSGSHDGSYGASSHGTGHERLFQKSGNAPVPAARVGIPMQTIVVSSDGVTERTPDGPFYYQKAPSDMKEFP